MHAFYEEVQDIVVRSCQALLCTIQGTTARIIGRGFAKPCSVREARLDEMCNIAPSLPSPVTDMKRACHALKPDVGMPDWKRPPFQALREEAAPH